MECGLVVASRVPGTAVLCQDRTLLLPSNSESSAWEMWQQSFVATKRSHQKMLCAALMLVSR